MSTLTVDTITRDDDVAAWGNNGPGYRVTLTDGFTFAVWRSTRTWERRTPGKRYVNARGETPCWRSSCDTRTFDTRKAAISQAILDREFHR